VLPLVILCEGSLQVHIGGLLDWGWWWDWDFEVGDFDWGAFGAWLEYCLSFVCIHLLLLLVVVVSFVVVGGLLAVVCSSVPPGSGSGGDNGITGFGFSFAKGEFGFGGVGEEEEGECEEEEVDGWPCSSFWNGVLLLLLLLLFGWVLYGSLVVALFGLYV